MTLLGSDKVFSHHRIFPHFVDVKEGNKLIYTGFINLSLVTFKYMQRKCATMKLSITFIKKNNDFRDRKIYRVTSFPRKAATSLMTVSKSFFMSSYLKKGQ